MPDGRSANVRSHRRGGRRHPSPWLMIGVVVVLLAGGAVAVWKYAIPKPCTGMDTAVIDAAPDITPILTQLNTSWAATKPSVDGKCVSVSIYAKSSALMAVALGHAWDAQTEGPAPTVWVPESSVWIQQAAYNATAQALMPDLQPSLARSPNVIAMPKDEAVALGWSADKPMNFDWSDLLKDAQTKNFWLSKGKPWGAFRFVMTKPGNSTAGLLTLLSIVDHDNSGSIVFSNDAHSDERQYLTQLIATTKQNAAVGDTSDVLTGMAAADTKSAQDALMYASAFPALEQDVITYNERDPKEPLVAIYPKQGSYDADNPYLILNNPSWGSAESATAAKAFEAYARSATAIAAFEKAGFRDSNRNGTGAAFSERYGVIADLNAPAIDNLPRSVLDPTSIEQTTQAWNAATTTSNVLIVLDVSRSMSDNVPGTDKTRLEQSGEAVTAALAQFNPGSSVGLWEFATNLDGSKDYRSVVGIGPLDGNMPGGNTRAHDLATQIGQLRTQGAGEGIYNTIDAAQKEVLASYDAQATNLVVVITDGHDSPASAAGKSSIDLDELKVNLTSAHSGTKNVPVITIGLGTDADTASLADIARTSGGVAYTSTGFDLDQVIEQALFNGPAQS